MLLNGEILFDQVNEGSPYTSSNVEVYGADQWRFLGDSAAIFTLRRSTTAPTGFQNSLQAYVTSAKTSILSNDNDHIEHPIEGYRIRELMWGTPNAKPLTIQFQIAASVAGDYSFAVMNGQNTTSYVTIFNIPVAGPFTPITITIPAEVGAVWNTTNTFGLKYIWDLGSGSTYEAPTLNTWNPAAYWRASGTIHLTTNAGAALYIAAVQDDIGNAALPFRYIDYEKQLRDLQRYFFKSYPQGIAVGNGSAGSIGCVSQTNGSTTGISQNIRFPVEMSSFPITIKTYNPVNANSKWYNVSLVQDSATPIIFNKNSTGFILHNPQLSTDTAGSLMMVNVTANARMGGY